jgi:thiosulfate/3-mercaptopyruvate sulfurtransferase
VPSHPLISATDLANRLDEVRVCDVRWYLGDAARGRSEYDEAHIPGAVFVDLETQLSAKRGPGRHPLPDPVRFAATLGRLGIGIHTPVVAYDSSGGAIAARLWWMLRALGHEEVAVLDGGWQAWVAGGQAVTDLPTVITPLPYSVLMSNWPMTLTADEVASLDHATVIDSRAPERYRGDSEPVDARPGHIPGAINLFHGANLTADGLHLGADQLAERFAGVGPEPVVYCGSGVTACHNILAMEIGGVTGVRLYPGSWSDWSSDPDRPAATGDRP